MGHRVKSYLSEAISFLSAVPESVASGFQAIKAGAYSPYMRIVSTARPRLGDAPPIDVALYKKRFDINRQLRIRSEFAKYFYCGILPFIFQTNESFIEEKKSVRLGTGSDLITRSQ